MFFGFCRGWEMEFGLVDCWRGVDWSGGNDGLKDGRPLGFARGKKPGGAPVDGTGGPPLQGRMPLILNWLLHIQFLRAPFGFSQGKLPAGSGEPAPRLGTAHFLGHLYL